MVQETKLFTTMVCRSVILCVVFEGKHLSGKGTKVREAELHESD